METAIKQEISSFPKIWHVGSPEVASLFRGPVEVTEKIDGSQFAFGRTAEGEFVMRSKGARIYPEVVQKMFKPVVEYALSIQHLVPEYTFFYGEAVTSPRHNTLVYEKTPKNFFMLYGVKVKDRWSDSHDMLVEFSRHLGCDVVPLIYQGEIESKERLGLFLELTSVLGNEKIEGVVIKNYNQLADSAFSRECFAKLVREGFKERNGASFPSKKDKIEEFLAQFTSEARWNKAVQHLKEDGRLTYSPKDIGLLIKEVQVDLLREEESFIKQALYEMYRKSIVGTAVKGLPEWWKNKLVEQQFSNEARAGVDSP